MAERWGVTWNDPGKVVWAELSVPPPRYWLISWPSRPVPQRSHVDAPLVGQPPVVLGQLGAERRPGPRRRGGVPACPTRSAT